MSDFSTSTTTPSGVFSNDTDVSLTTSTSLDLIPPATISPLEVLREEIISTWLPKCDEPAENFEAVAWFKEKEGQGLVTVKEYSAKELRAMESLDKLHWKESCHFENVLNRISLPLDTSRSFENAGTSPILFVKNPDRDCLVVMNGNHRTGKVFWGKHNPDNHPVHVLEFSSLKLYEKLTGDAGGWGITYLNVSIEPGDRRYYAR